MVSRMIYKIVCIKLFFTCKKMAWNCFCLILIVVKLHLHDIDYKFFLKKDVMIQPERLHLSFLEALW